MSAPDRYPGPGIDFLQSSQALQCLCPGGKASCSPPPPQPVPFVSSPLPFSQIFLRAAPPRLCQKAGVGFASATACRVPVSLPCCSAERYDPLTGTWTSIAAMSTRRRYVRVATLGG